MKHVKAKDYTEVLRARCKPILKQRVAELAERQHSDEAQIIRTAIVELLDRNEPKPSPEQEAA